MALKERTVHERERRRTDPTRDRREATARRTDASGTAIAPGKRTISQELSHRRAQTRFELAMAQAQVQVSRLADMADGPERAPALLAARDALAMARATAGATEDGPQRLAALEQVLAPLLAKGTASDETDTDDVIARHGVEGPGDPLPYLAQIQASFGRHDVTRIRAHTGERANASAKKLGAKGYAIGEHVAFAGMPDLFTAAHEAAHAIQQRAGIATADEAWELHADQVAQAVVARASAEPLLSRVGAGQRATVVQRRDASRPSPIEFAEASREVNALAAVKKPDGAYLLDRPDPKATRTHATPIPLGGRLWITRSTTQTKVAKRWCYVVAPDHGVSGFVPERWLLLHPPEPNARIHLVKKGETLHQIASAAYKKNFDEGNDARLYVHGLYHANQDLPSVKLTPVSLPFRDTVHRKEAEEETLKVYRGVQVVEGGALWIPSEAFIQQLKEAGAITSGSSELSKAWRTARDAVGAIIDTIKYVAGFIVGLLEGAWAAIADLFKGAADLIEGVAKIVWKLVSEGPGAVKALLDKWAGQMKQVWEKKGDLASAFLKKWNASNAWDRGSFHGEVMGWLFMTVLIVVLTMGESAPAALAGIAMRWPELVAVLRAVDTIGDVTRYVGGAAKAAALAARIPPDALANVTSRFGRRADKSSDAARAAETKAAKSTSTQPHAGAVKGKDVYPTNTFTKEGKELVRRLNPEKITKSLDRIRKTRKLIHDAELVVEAVTADTARLKVRVPAPGKPHIEVSVELKFRDTLPESHVHGGDAGPARLRLDEAGGNWRADVEISNSVIPEDLDFVVRHELDEAVEIVKRHPTGKPKAGFDAEHRAGVLTRGAAANARITAHDIAGARELAELHRDLHNVTTPANITRRAKSLDQALRAQGFDDIGQLGRKIEALRQAGVPDDFIKFVKEREAKQLLAGVSRVQPSRFTPELVSHLMHPRESNNFIASGISGGHHTHELRRFVDAHPRLALREVSVRNVEGLAMHSFEQYLWRGPGPKPPRGSGMAPGEPHFVAASWQRSTVPKTTFDDPHAFLIQAERAWASWSASPPATFARNDLIRMQAPDSSIRFGGFADPGPPATLNTIFPDASWF